MSILAILKENSAKIIPVLGLGKSGIAAAQFLLNEGHKVLALDEGAGDVTLLFSSGIATHPRCELKTHTSFCKALEGVPELSSLAILSPGVPPSVLKGSFAITNELELALTQVNSKPLCVTGTAGKSTTSALLYHMICSAGATTALAGNIGTPVLSILPELKTTEYPVIEVSSYQLEQAREFIPRIAVFLGLSENHLERHGTMVNYFEAKASLFLRLQEDGAAIINIDCEWGQRLYAMLSGSKKCITYSTKRSLNNQSHAGWQQDTHICFSDGEKINLKYSTLLGSHNIQNILAASLATRELGFSCQDIENSLATFQSLPHRLEPVVLDEKATILFLNDSKATTPQGTFVAIKACLREGYKRIYLLLGGAAKVGLSWEPVSEAILFAQNQNFHVIPVYFGASAHQVSEAVAEPGKVTASLSCALELLANELESGDIVLLSPGAASFDEFRNFEERGNMFKSWVKEYTQNL